MKLPSISLHSAHNNEAKPFKEYQAGSDSGDLPFQTIWKRIQFLPLPVLAA